MSSQHDRFLARLAASSEAVFAVARWLHRAGRRVEIPPIAFSPTAGDAEFFVDRGDLYVLEAGVRKTIQVKRIRREFTCAADWPFRGEALVGNRRSVERVVSSAYVTVSSDLRCAAIVGEETRPLWYLTKKVAGNTGNEEEFYACPLEAVVFRVIG